MESNKIDRMLSSLLWKSSNFTVLEPFDLWNQGQADYKRSSNVMLLFNNKLHLACMNFLTIMYKWFFII
jgi:hypothetical protein